MNFRYEKPALIFAATQRSGSTMVVDDFQNVTGRPRTESEAFYRHVLKADDMPASWQEAMERITNFRENEIIFFDKVMFHQLPKLSKMIDCENHTPMCYPFYNYFEGATWVYIRRADIFSQTVSKYIAETLDIWDKNHIQSDDFNSRIEFNLDKAKIHLKSLLKEDEQWKIFFNQHKIKPIQIYYEDAVENFPNYLTPIFDAIGFEANLSKSYVRRMSKVGNERNASLSKVLMHMMMRETMKISFDFQEFKKNNIHLIDEY